MIDNNNYDHCRCGDGLRELFKNPHVLTFLSGGQLTKSTPSKRGDLAKVSMHFNI